MRKVSLALLLCLLAFAACEAALRRVLFEHVSYSNSESIDTQLRTRNAAPDWNLLFIGDSETRWGISPVDVDAGMRAQGVNARSFNHAFDGFGASWWPRLLPHMLDEPALKHVEVVVLGIQLIDVHRMIRTSGEDCGALQRPVLTSPFATDLGVDTLCRNQSWDAEFGKKLLGASWVVRYPSAVRSLLLPGFMKGTAPLRFNSRSAGDPVRGFAPHRTIAQDRDTYDQEFARWKAQFDPARDFLPLAPTAWPALTAPAGFFDQFHLSVTQQGRRLALFAVPTNPVVIDTFRRRADYLRNSALLREWAASRGVVFVDAGIQDVPDADAYFSDMRHLSGIGARQYSRQLGEALALNGVLKAPAGKPSTDARNLK
jgi:hypothetical protein